MDAGSEIRRPFHLKFNIRPIGGSNSSLGAVKPRKKYVFRKNIPFGKIYMTPKMDRKRLIDGSFVDASVEIVDRDKWRPHGVRYRIAWIQDGKCRVLFDNHHGKTDHFHVDGAESEYLFQSIEQLFDDFERLVELLGGRTKE